MIMKLFRMIRFGIRDAFKSVFRNGNLSIASVTCISITLLVVSLALLASFNVKNFSKKIESDVSVVVFLDLGVTDDDVSNFRNQLLSVSNVDTKNELIIELKPEDRRNEIVENDEKLGPIVATIDNVNEIFHHSFTIKVLDITKIKATVNQIRGIDNVYSVNYGEQTVSQMISTFDIVEKVAFGIVIVLIFVSGCLIVNTIKLTIVARKREISIMRVVGASNFTIKNPFIIEGLLIGLFGSIIPIVITIYGYTAFYNSLDGHIYSSLIELIKPLPFIYIISAILALIGGLVGMIGSGRAVRKYLKV